jgi:hypothetical protein
MQFGEKTLLQRWTKKGREKREGGENGEGTPREEERGGGEGDGMAEGGELI